MSGKKTKRRKRKAPAVRKKTPILDLVIFADTHCGCQLGLVNADREVKLDGGGSYKPSRFQVELWRIFQEFWQWVDEATKGRPYVVVHAGDAMDGVHHTSTTQISHNHADQQRIAIDVLEPVVERCEGRFYMIRGTEAHTGQSAENEEKLAAALGAVPTKDGLRSRYEMRIDIGGEVVHIAHHIGVTTSAAYETSAVQREVVRTLNDAARWGRRAPRIVVRAHRHRGVITQVPGAGGDIYGIVIPGWQGKTPYVYRRADLGPPQFGGVLIRQGADGRVYPISYVVPIIDDDVVQPIIVEVGR